MKKRSGLIQTMVWNKHEMLPKSNSFLCRKMQTLVKLCRLTTCEHYGKCEPKL